MIHKLKVYKCGVRCYTLLVRHFLVQLFIIVFTGFMLYSGYLLVSPSDDVTMRLYECYAQKFVHGGEFSGLRAEKDVCTVKKRLPQEYPLLSLVPMVLAFMIGGDVYFDSVFILLTLGVIFGLYYFLLTRVSPGAGLVFLLYMVLGGFSIAVARLDIYVGALLLFSLYAAEKKWFRMAYILLAFAAMFKLVPFVFVVPLFFAEWRHNEKKFFERFFNVGIFLSICCLFFALSLNLDIKGTFSPFVFNSIRPFQIESVQSSVLAVLDSLHVIRICSGFEFGSENLYGFQNGICNNHAYTFYILLSQGLIFLSAGTFVLILCYLSYIFLKRDLPLSHFYLILLLALLSTNKVFSPQYLFWIFPIIAYIYWSSILWVIMTSIIALLTTIIYPFMYGSTTFFPYSTHFILLFALARNILVLLLTFYTFFNIFNMRTGKLRKL